MVKTGVALITVSGTGLPGTVTGGDTVPTPLVPTTSTVFSTYNGGGVLRPDGGATMFAVKRGETTAVATGRSLAFLEDLWAEPTMEPREMPFGDAIVGIPAASGSGGGFTPPRVGAAPPGAGPDRTPVPMPRDTTPVAVNAETATIRGKPGGIIARPACYGAVAVTIVVTPGADI